MKALSLPWPTQKQVRVLPDVWAEKIWSNMQKMTSCAVPVPACCQSWYEGYSMWCYGRQPLSFCSYKFSHLHSLMRNSATLIKEQLNLKLWFTFSFLPNAAAVVAVGDYLCVGGIGATQRACTRYQVLQGSGQTSNAPLLLCAGSSS